jgi:alkylation response protein AidB-like acyl-CoA dehydrogenase
MAVLNEEQTMLRDMAREWVANEAPVTAFRKLRDARSATGFDPASFAHIAEMGWTGIIVPEAFGGSDFGWLSLGLVVEEMGKTLVASPLAASAIAAAALIGGGNEEQKGRWLPRLVSGEMVGTLAVDEGPRHDPANVRTQATPRGDGYLVSGTKTFVAEGDGADLIVVAASTESGVRLFLVDGSAAGLTRVRRRMVDSRSHADIRLVEVAGELLPAGGDRLLDDVLDRARILAAAEMLGMAEQAFQTTLEYLKTRVQFNQVLATFQALQHRMARLYTDVELMRSAVEGALNAVDAGGDLAMLASLAKATANDTLNLVSREMVQLHGGIGMTDEYDAGFYLKRARVLENQWGNGSFHRERFARLSGF